MELAKLACVVFELDPSLLRSVAPDPEFMPGASIPYDTSLSVGRTAEILDYQPLSAPVLLDRFRQELATGAIVSIERPHPTAAAYDESRAGEREVDDPGGQRGATNAQKRNEQKRRGQRSGDGARGVGGVQQPGGPSHGRVVGRQTAHQRR